jgi:hypothetical protein
MLKIIVRLMKYWNIVNGNHLTSLHIELMVAEMWSGIDMSGRAVSDLLAATLRAMAGWVNSSCADPWTGNTRRIDSYLTSSNRQTAHNLLASDAKAATDAEDYRKAGNNRAAFERWGVVFRHNFPAFG